MFINELDIGTIVTITASDNERIVRLESSVVEVDSSIYKKLQCAADQLKFTSFVPLELVCEEGISVNFISAKVKCDLFAQYREKFYQWEDVKVFKLKFGDQNYHVAFCNDDAIALNRRTEFRLWLGIDAFVKLNDSNVPHLCVLKDLSNHGAGFVAEAKHNFCVGDSVNLQFHIAMKSDGDWSDTLYTGKYKVVRITATHNNKVLVGCTAYDESQLINKFLTYKQRERVRSGVKGALYKRGKDSDLTNFSSVIEGV